MITNKFKSPNFSTRESIIDFIIIHYTEMPYVDAINRLCDVNSRVSCHYFIKADGEIIRLVDDSNIAWHAGVSSWAGIDKLNRNSIGVELDNPGSHKYTSKQMQSCVELCKMLQALYYIPFTNILGHSDIAPDRKIDPGLFFDWSYLAKHNLGMWHDVKPHKDDTKLSLNFGDNNERVSTLQSRLKVLGYQIDLTGIFDWQTNYVVRAFQAHFCPKVILKKGMDFYANPESKYSWNNLSERILESLVTKKLLENIK